MCLSVCAFGGTKRVARVCFCVCLSVCMAQRWLADPRSFTRARPARERERLLNATHKNKRRGLLNVPNTRAQDYTKKESALRPKRVCVCVRIRCGCCFVLALFRYSLEICGQVRAIRARTSDELSAAHGMPKRQSHRDQKALHVVCVVVSPWWFLAVVE